MVSSTKNTVLKLVLGFGLAILVLVFALAYNMGETKQSGRSDETFRLLQRRVEKQKAEYRKCREYHDRLAAGDVSADEHLKMLEARLEFSTQRGKDLQEESTKLREEIAKCEADKKADRRLQTGTEEVDPEAAYQKLLWEHRQLRLTLGQLEGSRNQTREDLIKLIRTYRLDTIAKIKEAKSKGLDVSRRPKKKAAKPGAAKVVFDRNDVKQNASLAADAGSPPRETNTNAPAPPVTAAVASDVTVAPGGEQPTTSTAAPATTTAAVEATKASTDGTTTTAAPAAPAEGAATTTTTAAEPTTEATPTTTEAPATTSATPETTTTTAAPSTSQ